MSDQLLSKTGTKNKNVLVEQGQCMKKGKSADTQSKRNKKSGMNSPDPGIYNKGNIQTTVGPTVAKPRG